jgi:hypothetical protein
VRLLNYFRGLFVVALLALTTNAFAQTNLPTQTNALVVPPNVPAPHVAPLKISAAAAANFLNQEVVVTDRVAQVTLRPTVAFLNLSRSYPDSPLTCVIRGSDTNKFSNLKNYLNRDVEISGRVTEYQGKPEIVITETNQIIILNDIQPKPIAVPLVIEPTQALPQIILPAPNLKQSNQAATNVVRAAAPVATAGKNFDRTIWWIVGGFGAVIAILFFLVFLLLRQNRNAVRATGPIALLKSQNDATMELSAEDWKQRALAAEAMAGKQGQLLREKMMPELTEFAKQSLVQGLYAQRSVLIETQQKAQQALTQLESQLTSLHLPLQERIRAYEKRIAELEKEVETQGEEMRELTRATLILVRKKLEDEKEVGRAPGRFN